MNFMDCPDNIIYAFFIVFNVNHFFMAKMLFELFKLFLNTHTRVVFYFLWGGEMGLEVAGGAADDEAGFDDAFLGVVMG